MKRSSHNAKSFDEVRFLAMFAAALVCAFSLTSANAQTSCALPVSGIVSWWPGDGNANDIANTNNGTPMGAVSYAAGKVGEAFAFNANGEIVLVGNPTNLQLQTFTIEAWVQRTSANVVSWDPHAYKGQALFFAYGVLGYDFGINGNGTIYLSQTGVSEVDSAAPVQDTNWHHIAVTATTSGTVFFYVDGTQYPANSSYNPTYSFTTSAGIGGWPNNGYTFEGNIDELSVYNRVLSQAEIQAIYNAGDAGKCKPGIPQITAISVAKTNVIINFLTDSNYFYDVQTRTDLVSGSWSTITSNIPSVVGGVLGLGFTNYTDIGGAMFPQKFYRISHY